MKHLITLFSMALVLISGYAQEKDQSRSFPFEYAYELPASKEVGPMDVNVKGSYHFSRESRDGISSVWLHFKPASVEFVPKQGSHRFRHNGKVYNYQDLAGQNGITRADFESVRIHSVAIETTVTPLKNAQKVKVGHDWPSVLVGETDKDTDLNSLSLQLKESTLADIHISAVDLQQKLDYWELASRNRQAFKEAIAGADKAYTARDWATARSLYREAIALNPEEDYAQDQLEKVNTALAGNTRSVESPVSTTASLTATTPAATSGTEAADADADFWGTNLGKTNTFQTPAHNTESLATNFSQKINVGGEYVQVFQKDGKYYMNRADGSTQETTEKNYNAVLEALAKSQSGGFLIGQNEPSGVEKFMNEVVPADSALGQRMAKMQAKSSKLTSNINAGLTSFYTAQQAAGARASIKQNSILSGNFESIEEVEAAFQQQIRAIENDIATLEEANRKQINMAYNAAFSGASSTTQAYGFAAAGIGSLLSKAAAEKKKKQAEAELAASKQAQLVKIEQKKAEMRKQLRLALLDEFSDGGVPLSSHKVSGHELYFFVYAYDTSTLMNKEAAIMVSNIFPLGRYSDGTWPFKNSILNEAKSSKELQATGNKAPLTMVGYYTTQQLAEQTRESFLRLAAASQLEIKPFTYKGKPSKSGAAAETAESDDAGVDFWGNPVKKNGAKKEEPAKSDSGVDFWGNPVKKD